MPWKFQYMDDKWEEFDNDANREINEALSVSNFNTRRSTANPRRPLVSYVQWSEWNADTLDYDTNTDYTLNLETMVQSQPNSTSTCMVRGYWDQEPWKPFVWEEYLDAVLEQQMRLTQVPLRARGNYPMHYYDITARSQEHTAVPARSQAHEAEDSHDSTGSLQHGTVLFPSAQAWKKEAKWKEAKWTDNQLYGYLRRQWNGDQSEDWHKSRHSWDTRSNASDNITPDSWQAHHDIDEYGVQSKRLGAKYAVVGFTGLE